MERDCQISHGASSVLQERLFYQSDYYEGFICQDCGLFSTFLMKNKYWCKSCKSTRQHRVALPYACKLLFQELMSMGITPRMKV